MGDPLALLLLLFGFGFLAASLAILADLVRYRRRAAAAVVTWRLPVPRPANLSKAIALVLAGLLFYKLVILGWPVSAVFGEGMMFLYYTVWYPVSFTIERGVYEDGLWLERGFVRFDAITALTWRDEPGPTLIVVDGRRRRAGRLEVPIARLGEVRRILRDRISAGHLRLDAPLLDLGGHDRRDDV